MSEGAGTGFCGSLQTGDWKLVGLIPAGVVEGLSSAGLALHADFISASVPTPGYPGSR